MKLPKTLLGWSLLLGTFALSAYAVYGTATVLSPRTFAGAFFLALTIGLTTWSQYLWLKCDSDRTAKVLIERMRRTPLESLPRRDRYGLIAVSVAFAIMLGAQISGVLPTQHPSVELSASHLDTATSTTG